MDSVKSIESEDIPYSDAPERLGDDVVILNLRGKLFSTRKSNLQKYPETLLGKAFAPGSKFNHFPMSTGTLFIDQNPEHFQMILDFYTLNIFPEAPKNVSEEWWKAYLDFFLITDPRYSQCETMLDYLMSQFRSSDFYAKKMTREVAPNLYYKTPSGEYVMISFSWSIPRYFRVSSIADETISDFFKENMDTLQNVSEEKYGYMLTSYGPSSSIAGPDSWPSCLLKDVPEKSSEILSPLFVTFRMVDEKIDERAKFYKDI